MPLVTDRESAVLGDTSDTDDEIHSNPKTQTGTWNTVKRCKIKSKRVDLRALSKKTPATTESMSHPVNETTSTSTSSKMDSTPLTSPSDHGTNKYATRPLQGADHVAYVYIGGINPKNTCAEIKAHLMSLNGTVHGIQELPKPNGNSKSFNGFQV